MLARKHMATLLPAPCFQCGHMVQPTDQWVIEHKQTRGAHPELTWETSNWAHSHRRCSSKTGQAGVIAKAKAEVHRQVGTNPNDRPVSSGRPPRQ